MIDLNQWDFRLLGETKPLYESLLIIDICLVFINVALGIGMLWNREKFITVPFVRDFLKKSKRCLNIPIYVEAAEFSHIDYDFYYVCDLRIGRWKFRHHSFI